MNSFKLDGGANPSATPFKKLVTSLTFTLFQSELRWGRDQTSVSFLVFEEEIPVAA